VKKIGILVVDHNAASELPLTVASHDLTPEPR